MRWRSTISAATVGRGAGDAVASCCASMVAKTKVATSSSVLSTEGVFGLEFMMDWAGAGVLHGLLLGCGGPIGKLLLSLISFLFSIFIFYFEFCFISNLFCRIFMGGSVWSL
jgi:hypothetical protein